MEINHIDATKRAEWNDFVEKEPFFSLLQSWEWGEIKANQGWKPYHISVNDNGKMIAAAQMLIRSSPFGLASFAYIPRGPIGDWLAPGVSELLFSEIHRIARANHVTVLKIEPDILDNAEIAKTLEQHNFHASTATNQPRTTIIMDLCPGLETLNEQVRKSTRRKIKDAAKKGIEIRTGTLEDLPAFYELMEITCKRAGFSLRPYEYYLDEWQVLSEKGQNLMLMAWYENKLVAVHISYFFGKHAAFFHQASSDECANMNPNSLLVWEAVKLLKEKGCCSYDLWGICDEIGEIASHGGELPGHERTDGLWGVYQFKSGFCKNIVYFIGAYDYVYQPLLYKVISSKTVNTNLERISIRLQWLNQLQR